MKRRLLNLLTLLSLLLCVAVVAAWGWSFHRSDRFEWRWVENGDRWTAWGDTHLSSAAGGLAFSTRRSSTWGADVTPTVRRDPPGLSWTTYRPPTYPRRVDGPRFAVEAWGFAWDRRRSRATRDWGEGDRTEESARWLVIVPHAALALPLAALPLGRGVIVWRSARRRPAPAAVCLACGYDMRATPGRCPECGTEATT